MTSILSWILLQSWWYVIIYIHASPNSWGILLIPWYSIIKRGTTMDFCSIITELMAQSCVWLFLINIYKKCKDYSKWEGGHTRKRPFIRLHITWMAHTCTININYLTMYLHSPPTDLWPGLIFQLGKCLAWPTWWMPDHLYMNLQFGLLSQ